MLVLVGLVKSADHIAKEMFGLSEGANGMEIKVNKGIRGVQRNDFLSPVYAAVRMCCSCRWNCSVVISYLVSFCRKTDCKLGLYCRCGTDSNSGISSMLMAWCWKYFYGHGSNRKFCFPEIVAGRQENYYAQLLKQREEEPKPTKWYRWKARRKR